MQRNVGHFGHGVIGKEQHAAEQKQVVSGANVFGPGVLDLHPDAVNKPGPGVAGGATIPPDAPSLSVAEMHKVLRASPQLVDTLLPAELQRPGGPRKGALAALEAAEDARTGGAREDVLAAIAAAAPEPDAQDD